MAEDEKNVTKHKEVIETKKVKVEESPVDIHKSISDDSLFDINIAMNVFSVNRRQKSFLVKKHGEDIKNKSDWKAAFINDDIHCEQDLK